MAKLSENVKNMRNHVGKIFGKKQAQKIGTYMESTGGGTPLKKGEKLKDHPEAKRVQQPRDEEGKFTYNSANAKPLKYGPSRGETVPPFLRGAKIMFAVKKKNGIVSGGTTWNFTIDMTAADLVEKFQDILGAKSAADLVERKKGRKSNAEKQAIKKKDEGFVNSDTKLNDWKIEDFRTRCYDKLQIVKPKPKKNVYVKKEEKPQEQPKVVNNKFDVSLAKTNREEFKRQNKEVLNELAQTMKGIPEDEIVNIIAEEEITDKDELIDLYNIAIKGAQ